MLINLKALLLLSSMSLPCAFTFSISSHILPPSFHCQANPEKLKEKSVLTWLLKTTLLLETRQEFQIPLNSDKTKKTLLFFGHRRNCCCRKDLNLVYLAFAASPKCNHTTTSFPEIKGFCVGFPFCSVGNFRSFPFRCTYKVTGFLG